MCEITAGISQSCEYSLGGLKNLYLTNWDNIDQSTGVTQDGTGNVTAITMSAGTVFYQWEFVKNTGAITEEVVVNDVSRYFQQTLSFNIGKKDQAKNTQFELLGLSKIVAIAETQTGEAFLLGWTNPLEISVMTANIGANAADSNGYVATLSAEQVELANTVDTSIIAGLL